MASVMPAVVLLILALLGMSNSPTFGLVTNRCPSTVVGALPFHWCGLAWDTEYCVHEVVIRLQGPRKSDQT